MAKLPKLDHVKYVRSKGRVYAYFNTGVKDNGKPIYKRLPDPASPGFYASYGSYVAGRSRRQAQAYTVAKLCDEYECSREFATKAKSTQAVYRLNLSRIADIFGKFSVNELDPPMVRKVLDVEQWGAATQNLFVATLGAAYTWGRQRQKAAVEPTKDIGVLKTGEHSPWPADILDAALASDSARIRLAAHLLYYTGQRIGDVCKMRWGDIRDGMICFRQDKTGKEMEIPLHMELRAELDRTPKLGITILTAKNGSPITQRPIRDALQAFTAALGVETVPHGLRKNAVNVMLEQGCSVAEVAAITGQSYQVVEHYAAKVNTRKLGKAAMLKFEGRAVRNQKAVK